MNTPAVCANAPANIAACPQALTQSRLALASAVGLLALSGAAQADFLADGHATLNLRNNYANQDFRAPDSPSINEWGQSFLLDYKSGFTEGSVGFGVDVLGMWAVRLNGGGDADKLDSSRAPHTGGLFPRHNDGTSPNEFGRLGVTGKVRYSKTEARVGTLLPKLPVLVYSDARLVPQTFEGVQLTSREFDDLTLIAGQLAKVAERNENDYTGMSIAGANRGPRAQDSNQFQYAGIDYQINKNLLAQYYYGSLQDFYQQHFLGLVHTQALPVGTLKTDLRYFDSGSDGKNGSAAGRAEGYVSSGYYGVDAAGRSIVQGEVDNRVWSGQFTYSLGGHALSAGYQQSSGNSDFPHINEGHGRTVYLIGNAQLNKFTSAGERVWVTSYGYDFASLGVPGLKASATYFSGDSIDDAQGDRKEWERDLRLDYAVQSGLFKGVGFMWRHGLWRGNDLGQKDQEEHVLLVSYSLPLF